MKNLTYLQKRILNKLLPNLIKTEPYEELLRVSLLYRQIKDIKKDNFLFEKYKAIINNSLYFHLKSKDSPIISTLFTFCIEYNFGKYRISPICSELFLLLL